ncbi:HPr kinase/phosphorylase [Novosphingobium mangrovi (ex Hu et al. 2023)]|uniref:HPr kinase/phosphatase C-terminal domain-containing protein n=1 Tax=Novosphingobium mangrovi (ex Hu et al. 2023) TaxID=2930094 RepID=A0ABT0AA18_9SPHN|nr:HPr kinase/phosphatase C-terminal domain-containing protein [Novosphingobium mangrovi (ex Hu et al. 2023)]MCJ1960045.1 HPr kinase/phosphatase C-terminal domain-containing protein [Novosphingobium mangrovi (ex Hu et al. 2023)]
MTTGASPSLVRQATCVAREGRAILIEGPSGAGKTSLALELIDRGAVLVGDDGVVLERRAGHLVARPHPRTAGLIEVRNLGIQNEPFCAEARVCLHILLDSSAPRFIEKAEGIELAGLVIPSLRLSPWSGPMAIKAERALAVHGLGPSTR